MNILAGIPNVVHREITVAEVDALKAMGITVETSSYGNSNEVTGVAGRMKRILLNAWQLATKAKKYKSDFVYLNTAFDHKTITRDSITVFFIRLFNPNVKIGLKLHGSMENIVAAREGLIAKLKNYLLSKIDLLFVLSSEEKNNFIKIGIPASKLKVVGNALDRSLYAEDKTFKNTLSNDGQQLILLFVGRLMREKGVLDLIDACKIVKDKGVRFQLYCLGDGPERQEMEENISKLGLGANVTLVGHIPEAETSKYYANCDILLLPSYNEGFPMAVFRAVAAGKPIITTEIRACADHLIERENCLFSTIGDADSIAEAICTLGADKELRAKMGENNLQLSERFSKENIAADIVKGIKQLINSGKEIEPSIELRKRTRQTATIEVPAE